MKARSSSPVHVHVNKITPVYVHVQRSKSVPALIEKSHVVISASATNPERMSTKKEGKRMVQKKDRMPKQSHKERAPHKSTITSRQAEKISSVIHSSDFDFKKDALDRHGYDLRVEMEGLGHKFSENRRKDFLEEVSEDLISTTTEDMELAADLTGYSAGLENRTQGSIRLHNSPSTLLGDLQMNRLGKDGHAEDKRSLLKTLIEAEMAANSAAIQLVSFKDSVAEYSDDGRLANQDVMRMSRQRNLLLEKLDNFKVINKTLRHLLKDLQGEETSRLQADKHVDVLLKKLTEAESENMHLRRRIDEKERIIEELRDMRQKDRDNTDTVVQLSKSVEATRAHLQGQLRNKESENSRMTTQLRGLEQTVTERKLEIEHLKSQISHVKEKADQEKEALKKATRAQKQRAVRFERAVEKLQDQLKDKDIKLIEARSAANTWRSHQEQSTEEKAQLEAKITTLQHQITDLIEQLQKARDGARISSEDILQKVEAVNSETANLNLENARLKASIAALEEQATCTEAELKEQKENADQHKDLAEQYKTQVKDLQKEAEELKTRFEHVLKENELSKDTKETEVSKVKRHLEARVKELETFPDLLKAAEQRLQDCQENLLSCERRYSHKSHVVSQLQVKVENQTQLLESSREKVGLLHKENLELQLKLDAVHRKIEDVQSENQQLVQELSRQEEALHYSGKQLEERSAQCLALTRQLEAALADVRKQVTDLKDKASDKERALQSKILELETENSRREKELKQLKQANKSAEKQFEVRLKDLQLNLDQSESHKQSIQNYVEFLKTSYNTMFGEGISPNLGTSSFF
ncbi:outer dense fiber protein 2-like isoform X2 [Acipenser ruthenus]|nr:outer dense fiber protein 2-like isoform X2 [Acipenser ruthenus]XP_058887885.1 outer dense fiber protein 2-like isoform X2 [Acipenser ruthenus]XP_058887886.1 outer dense fiber protein 2-like isoform X2 [Acipenser ruthenus]